MCDKERASKYGLMAQCTKAGGWTIRPTAKVDSSTLTVTYMTACGSMTRHMDTASTAILMERNTKVNGKTISSMAKASRPGPMAPSTTVLMSKERSTGTANSLGRTAAPITVSLSKTISKAKASTTGRTVDSIPATGLTTRWKAKVYSLGPTAANTRASTSTTKRKVKVTSTGPMVACMMEDGRTASNMESAHTRVRMARLAVVFGKRAKESKIMDARYNNHKKK